MGTPRGNLDVIRVLHATSRELVAHRRSLLRAAVPLATLASLISYALWTTTQPPPLHGLLVESDIEELKNRDISPEELKALFAYSHRMLLNLAVVVATKVVAGTLIAVSTHRIILLRQAELPNQWGIFWSRREFSYAWRIVLLFCIWFVAPVFLTLPLSQLPFFATYDDFLVGLLMAPFFYVATRCSLILPAMAVEKPISIADSWEFARGSSLRLLIALAVVPMVASAAGSLGTRPLPPSGAGLAAAETFAFTLLGLFEIATLSIAYRTLTGLPNATAPPLQSRDPTASGGIPN